MSTYPLKKNQELICDVIDLDDRALGVVRYQEYVGFVDNALPGERIKLRVDKCKKDFFLATCLSIELSSKNRVTPFCNHFGQCGGCNLQHLKYEEHANIKKRQWLSLFKKTTGLTCPITPQTIFETSKSYRRKARISCRYVAKKNKVCVGFREKQGRFVLDGQYCPLLVTNQMIFQQLSELLTGLTIAEHVPQVEYAVDNNHTHLIFRLLTHPTENDIKALCEFCVSHGYLGALQINKSPQTISLKQPHHTIMHCIMQQAGSHHIMQYKTLDYTLEANNHDFVQVNKTTNNTIASLLVKWAKNDTPESIIDLFCGIGNFTIPLSFYSNKTIGIEGSESMVKKAQENATANQSPAKFMQADLTQVDSASWPYGPCDWLVIDPPRSGAKEIVDIIAVIKPINIIYISCSPASLMRDLMVLFNEKYNITEAVLVDMFAQTAHCESVVKLSRSPSITKSAC